MRVTSRALVALTLNAMGCASGGHPSRPDSFKPDEIRAAECAVIAALESPDPTAWDYHYTEDAILLEPGAAPVQGREALLLMARSMMNWRNEADDVWRLAHEVFLPDSPRQ